MLKTKSEAEAVRKAGAAIIAKLLERVRAGESATIVEDDLPDLVAELDLIEHSDERIDKALQSLYVSGMIDLDQPDPEQLKNVTGEGNCGLRIKLLIKP